MHQSLSLPYFRLHKARTGLIITSIALGVATLVATRALLEESEHSSYSDQFRREIEIQAEIRRSADALEGRNAFVEKRAARFSGR